MIYERAGSRQVMNHGQSKKNNNLLPALIMNSPCIPSTANCQLPIPNSYFSAHLFLSAPSTFLHGFLALRR